MGLDTYTEVTTQSWGSRIKQSFSGIIFGILFVVAAFILLFWNEGRAVKRAQALEEGSNAVISVTQMEVDPLNNQKLIHLSGTTECDERLSDDEFPVEVQGIKLSRKAEMYQWDEDKQTKTKEKVGGKKETTTTYSYHKTWSASVINSSSFKKSQDHENPGSMPYQTRQWSAHQVKLGAFELNDSQISRLNRYQGYNLPSDILTRMDESAANQFIINGNELYRGQNPSSPQIGDVRITFSWVPPGETISLVAQQSGDSFVPYVAKSGSEIDFLVSGNKTAEAMFASEKSTNTLITWLLRAGGFLLMFIGFRTIMAPARTLAAVVPFLAKLVGWGLSLVSGLLALVFSLLTIAVAWFFYRPILSVVLVVIVILAIVGFKFVKGSAAAEIPAPPVG